MSLDSICTIANQLNNSAWDSSSMVSVPLIRGRLRVPKRGGEFHLVIKNKVFTHEPWQIQAQTHQDKFQIPLKYIWLGRVTLSCVAHKHFLIKVSLQLSTIYIVCWVVSTYKNRVFAIAPMTLKTLHVNSALVLLCHWIWRSLFERTREPAN